MTTAETRQHVHGMWDAVAEQWEANADFVDAKGAVLSKTMLDAVAVGTQDRVLELASGTGGLGIAAAARAREVVVSDVSPAMVAAATRRAADLANVTAKVLDLEEIAEPDASFDVVLCREGLMFAVDPTAALREIQRVLRRSGRLAAAVWGPVAENPWLGLVFDHVSQVLGRPMPPPGVPGPFSLCEADVLRGFARDAGFTNCVVEEHHVPTYAASFDEWWLRTAALAGPLAKLLPLMAPDDIAELVTRLRDATRSYTSEDGALTFPGVSLLLTAVTRA